MIIDLKSCGREETFLDSIDDAEIGIKITTQSLGDGFTLYVVKVGGSILDELNIEKKGDVLEKVENGVHLYSQILFGDDRPFSLSTKSKLVGDGEASGNYGFLCSSHQSIRRRSITFKKWEDVVWDAFGLCPHNAAWYRYRQ